jgi:diguanylate cyclase (GGDEF)-like protein
MAAGQALAFVGMVSAAVGGGVLAGVALGQSRMRHERDAALHEARTDALTGLPNRTAAYRELDARARSGEAYMVALFDLDRFKALNDHLGHEAGDQALIIFARRLREATPGGFAARLHGDEFLLVTDAAADAEAADKYLREVCQATCEPMALDDHFPVYLWASVGVALAAPGESISSLLHRADMAMYRAKGEELGVAVYDRALDGVRVTVRQRPRLRLRDRRSAEHARRVAARRRRAASSLSRRSLVRGCHRATRGAGATVIPARAAVDPRPAVSAEAAA